MAGARCTNPRRTLKSGRPADFASRAQLNDRQQLFVVEYLARMNATQAALAAGYSPKCAAVQGHHNLRNPKIRAAIDEGLRQRAMGAEEVIARISDNARFDLSLFTDEAGNLNMTEATKKGLLRYVKRLTRSDKGRVTFEFHDSQAAAIKLGEHHGLFKQQVEHTGKDGAPLFSKDSIRVIVVGALEGEG